jgi:uncharacterized protein (TIGR02996 family)
MTPTLDTGAALLRAVLDEPDDDLPRLAYADLLEEEAGGPTPRAEFIRVQVEIGRVRLRCQCLACVRRRGGGRHADGGCLLDRHDGVRLQLREWELFRLHAGEWSVRVPTPRGDWHYVGSRVQWRRGFVESVELPADDWLAHADALLACQPVREATLTTRFRFGVVGGRPGLALFGEGRQLLRFIEPDADMPETLDGGDGPLWIVAKLWPGVAFILPFP